MKDRERDFNSGSQNCNDETRPRAEDNNLAGNLSPIDSIIISGYSRLLLRQSPKFLIATGDIGNILMREKEESHEGDVSRSIIRSSAGRQQLVTPRGGLIACSYPIILNGETVPDGGSSLFAG